MTRIGNSVNGTRYSNAGWAALYTSDATVAVTKPGENKTITRSKLVYFIRFSAKILLSQETFSLIWRADTYDDLHFLDKSHYVI